VLVGHTVEAAEMCAPPMSSTSAHPKQVAVSTVNSVIPSATTIADGPHALLIFCYQHRSRQRPTPLAPPVQLVLLP
jgi:hypothetical protein